MKLSFRSQLLIPSSIALVLLLITSVTVYFSIDRLLKTTNWVEHTYKVIGSSNKIMATLVDQETGMRGFAVSGDEAYLEPYNKGKAIFESEIEALQETVSDNPAQVARLNIIDRIASDWKDKVAEEYIALRKDIKKGEKARVELFALIESGIGKRSMDEIRNLVASSNLSKSAKDQLILDMVNMETGLRGFLLNSKTEYLEPYNAGLTSINAHIDDFNVSNRIITAIDTWIKSYAEVAISTNTLAMESADMEQLYARFATKEGKKYMDEMRDELGIFSQIESSLLTERKAEADSTALTTKILLLTITLVALIVSSLLVLFISRRLINQLGGEPDQVAEIAQKLSRGDLSVDTSAVNTKTGIMRDMLVMVTKLREVIGSVWEGTTTIAAASDQLRNASHSVSQGANEQAASAEELSSSMEEMSANITQNTDNANQTEKIAIKASKDITEGSEVVNKTVESMKLIAEKISVIGKIAQKTDILALNAAVEAARAGENGKGFAVVASEVRKLAERSLTAAEEIDEVSRTSVEIAERSGEILKKIVPDINKTAELVQEITAASVEQSSGANQVNTAIQQFSQVTQQNAASSEELASSSESLSSQASELKRAISYFSFGNEQDKPAITAYKQPASPLSAPMVSANPNPARQPKTSSQGYDYNISPTDEKDDDFINF